MDLGLEGKTALVTGGAQGIGSAIAARLAREGVRVAIADISQVDLQEGKQKWSGAGGEPILISSDLSTTEGVDEAVRGAVAGLGEVPSILVNNVGVAVSRSFVDIDDEAWNSTFQLNFMSYVRTSRSLAPRMAERPGSAIVNIASDLAKQPDSVPADYGAMKAAVLYLSKVLALDFAPAVRTNAVLPGPVWTRLWTRPGGVVDRLAELYQTDRDRALEKYLHDRHLPMGIAEPDDVGDLVAFLVSPRAARINGAAFDVGGTIRGLL